ncbi:uncharacterized protein LOC131162428 isoform X2 [Malania oleifera]|uniref:uncharacterized protein LOC131162428 isoform X2 n=1 Tax=Malania oleifera TaxID=397392 RepID=UPI0025AE0017|nr:uncharacterized protein LOC131162428 isoform X2 [Malania oleifera]
MVKTVVGEETQLKLAEDRLTQSGVPSEVGLVIGKLSAALDRGFVFDLVPTPPNDAGEPACSLMETARDDKRKGSKGKSQAESSSLVIDQDWVAEHARQVSRMLVGGMKVVGIYVWVSDSLFKNSTLVLCQTVKGVAEAAHYLEGDWDERLIIHISYSPRKWSCRNYVPTSNITSSSLRPCDFKMGRVLTSFQTFRCMYYFDLRLPIFLEGASHLKTLTDIIRYGISIHARELKSAKAMINGNLVVKDKLCASDGLHEVELLLPFMSGISMEACNQKEVLGVLVFSGCICSFAYLNSKEPVSQALDYIKGDIIMSLQTRLDILLDEADGGPNCTVDDDEEASSEMSTEKPIPQLSLHLLRKQCSLSFPQRIFVPWLAGTFICDYLQPSETLEGVKDHCVELMSMEAPMDASSILKPESEAPTLTIKSLWDVAAPAVVSQSSDCAPTGCITNKTRTENLNILAAVLILLLSIFVGWLLFFIRAP